MPKKNQDIGYIAYAVFQQMEFLLDEHDRGVTFFFLARLIAVSEVACEVQWYSLQISIILIQIIYFFRAVLKMFLMVSDLMHYRKSEK